MLVLCTRVGALFECKYMPIFSDYIEEHKNEDFFTKKSNQT